MKQIFRFSSLSIVIISLFFPIITLQAQRFETRSGNGNNNRLMSSQRNAPQANISRGYEGLSPQIRQKQGSIGQRNRQVNRQPFIRPHQNLNNGSITDRNNHFNTNGNATIASRNFDINRGSTPAIASKSYRSRNNTPSRSYYGGNRVVINNNVRVNYSPRRYVYAGAPRYSVLPRSSVYIQFGGHPYYYNNGLFFNYYGGFYQPVYAPYGIRVQALPVNCFSLYVGPSRYYYSNGFFYQPFYNSNYQSSEYEVVQAPVGATVYDLPKGANAVLVNGETFFEFNGTYYKQDLDHKGRTIYTVTGKNQVNNTEAANSQPQPLVLTPGDVLQQLPDGSISSMVNGEQMFISPNGIYLRPQSDGDGQSYLVVERPVNLKPTAQQNL